MSKIRIIPTLKGVVALSAITLANPGLASEHENKSISRAVDYRTSVMTVVGWNFKPMGAMLQGKTPYDKAAFVRHAQDFQAATTLNFIAGFPEDSDEHDDTAAKAEIWMDFEDFEKKFKQLQTEAEKLNKVVQGGDMDAIGQQFAVTGKTCKACHKKYKE